MTRKPSATRASESAAPRGRTTKPPETEPAQEWGERLETGRAIQRGGKTKGPVPGGEDHEEAE